METYKGDNPGKYGRSIPNLVNRQTTVNDTVINVNEIEIGGNDIVIIAGPCAVENMEQILETAKVVSSGGG
jgi:3-deoxy-7-phosphoheptulonate synthase